MRWSLAGTDEAVAQQLRDYVTETSWATFTGMAGLSLKTWRLRTGEWFEGDYVFATDEARQSFQDDFTGRAEQAPISVMLGAGPVDITAFEVVAVAEGWEGFAPSQHG